MKRIAVLSIVMLLVAVGIGWSQTLDGERIVSFNDTTPELEIQVSSRCKADGTGTFTFSFACTAGTSCDTMEGPYVGAFTESGSVVFTKDKTGTVARSLNTSFGITSPQGNVTGSRSGITSQGTNWCYFLTGQSIFGMNDVRGLIIDVDLVSNYRAKTPSGSDSGSN